MPNVCSREQTCFVQDTLPLRTILCKCPDDTYTDLTGRCIQIRYEQTGCKNNDDCSNTDKCINGNCILACSIERCGLNAQCISKDHRSICTCAPAYYGNPHIECNPSKVLNNWKSVIVYY